MITMQIDIGRDKISKKILKQLGDKSLRASVDATNRALAGMRTDATRLIVAESGLNRKSVFSAFTVIKSSVHSSQNGRVDIVGNPVGLVKFKHNPKKPMTGKTRRGVRVSIGQKTIVFRHAFVAVMPNGHVGIFERQRGVKTESGKTKIQELFGPSIPQFAARRHIVSVVQEKAQQRYATRFTQQLERWLQQTGAK